MTWRSTENPPHDSCFIMDEDGLRIFRVLVAIDGVKEAQKGTCVKRSGRSLKWQIDGHSGHFFVSHWMKLPDLPKECT